MRDKIKNNTVIGIMLFCISFLGVNQVQMNSIIEDQEEQIYYITYNNYTTNYYNDTSSYYNITDIYVNNTNINITTTNITNFEIQNETELTQYYEYIEVRDVPQVTTISILNINITNNILVNYVAVKWINVKGYMSMYCWYDNIRDERYLLHQNFVTDEPAWYIYKEVNQYWLTPLPIIITNAYTSFNISMYYLYNGYDADFDIIIGWLQ